MSNGIVRIYPDKRAYRKNWRTGEVTAFTGDVVVTVDIDAIALALGTRALSSKGRKSVGLSGLVTVKARNVKREKGVPDPLASVRDSLRARAGQG